MALDLADYETKARDAIMAFWGNREKARQKQLEAGVVDQGERASEPVLVAALEAGLGRVVAPS